MRSLLALSVLMLAACAQTGAPETYAEAPPGEAPPPASLAGDWSVMLLDGDSDDGASGVPAQANGERIWLMPSCAGQSLGYRISGNRIAMTRPAPGPVCEIGMPPGTDETMAALAQADTVESAPAGAIRMHGGGLVLLLVPRKGVDE